MYPTFGAQKSGFALTCGGKDGIAIVRSESASLVLTLVKISAFFSSAGITYLGKQRNPLSKEED